LVGLEKNNKTSEEIRGFFINKNKELTMADEPKVTIDEKDYLIEDLSDDAKAQLGSMQVVDQKLANLQQEIGIMQTARNAYANALTAALPNKN
jgi:hypothetical protein